MELSAVELDKLRAGVFDPAQRDVALYRTYYQTEHWRTVRRRVLTLRPLCEKCQARRSEHVHHQTYRRLGRELAEDLQAVCAPCHHRLHGRRF